MVVGLTVVAFGTSAPELFVSLAGAMSTAELGKSLAAMIRQDKVHIISCTGANLAEDLMNLVAHKLGPAIAGGNSVILKPATVTPLSGLKLCEAFMEIICATKSTQPINTTIRAIILVNIVAL